MLVLCLGEKDNQIFKSKINSGYVDMGKKLTEMTIEELWQLFPIILTKHQDVWTTWYDEERELWRSLLPEND